MSLGSKPESVSTVTLEITEHSELSCLTCKMGLIISTMPHSQHCIETN